MARALPECNQRVPHEKPRDNFLRPIQPFRTLRGMTADALREKLDAEPFELFQMRLPHGRALRVPHPEFVSLAPAGRIAIIWKREGERYSTVDLLLVSDLEPMQKNGKRRRRG